MMRIGQGYDVHAFIEGDHVMIGGIKIPHHFGVKAHSDGDVLLHALGDALLGAAALGDLGQHFSDKDPQYSNMSSSEFIKKIIALLKEKSYQVMNIDSTVITESPRLAKHTPAMRTHIADLLGIPESDVSIKATTNEKMGWIGQGEGLAAMACVLLGTVSVCGEKTV